MNRKSYALNHADDIKEHKLFRGLRCYLSSFSRANTTPLVLTNLRAINFVNRLSLLTRSVALLSFHKSDHNAILIKNTGRRYSYVSAFSDRVIFLDNVCKDKVIEAVCREEAFWRDELAYENVVCINGLNTEKMVNYVREHAVVYKYKKYSNNCARFAADVLLAGCDTMAGKFRHNRPWQMPANTLELAKEINLSLRII